MHRRLFLRWSLLNTLFVVALTAAAVGYHGNLPTPAAVAAAAVLAVYAAGAGYAGRIAWRGHGNLEHVDRAASYCPKIAMLGTVSGFLVALSGAGDVAQRISGASTGLAATFVGIAAMVALELQHHMLETAAAAARDEARAAVFEIEQRFYETG